MPSVRGSFVEQCSSLYRLLGEDQVGWELAPVAHLSLRSSSDRRHGRGACRSEVFVASEHEPDGFGELAGDLHPGHLGAALSAQPAFGPLVVLLVARMTGGVDGRLDESPPQVFR